MDIRRSSVSTRWICVTLLTLVAVSQSACVGHQLYQKNPVSAGSESPEHSCDLYPKWARDARDGFDAFGVEFTDQGAYFERAQGECAIEYLREQTRTNDVLIVVFAHGWKHNAANDDENVMSFRRMLKYVAIDEKYNSQTSGKVSRKVIGIYLGWRGKSLDLPIIENLTFWNRKSAAEIVGAQAVAEFLVRVEKIALDAKRSDRTARLVIIGHSFGGDVIYSALAQLLVDRIVNSTTDEVSAGASPVRGFGDLVILVNPSFEAAKFRVLHELSKNNAFALQQKPILLVATSTSDLATKVAFPIGRTISEVAFDRPTDHAEHKEDLNLAVTAVGHYEPYATHILSLSDLSMTAYCAGMYDDPAGVKVRREVTRRFNEYTAEGLRFGGDFNGRFEKPADSIWLEEGVLVPLYPGAAHNSVVVARTTHTVIADHNDIWNCNFTGFVLSFLRWVIEPDKVETIGPVQVER